MAGLAESFASGLAFAQRQSQLDIQRETLGFQKSQLEETKRQFNMTKGAKILDDMSKIVNEPDTKHRSNRIKYFKGQLEMLGIPLHPLVESALGSPQKSQEYAAVISELQAAVQEGRVSPEVYSKAIEVVGSEKADEIVSQLMGRLQELRKIQASGEEARKTARVQGEESRKTATVKGIADIQKEVVKAKGKKSAGQEAADKKYGQELALRISKGGYADAERGLKQLDDAIIRLGKTDSATGSVIGLAPKFIRNRITPEGAAIQDQVEELVQRNLRLILGAQFTEKEGQRLIDRAYNTDLSEEENIKRLGRLRDQMAQALEVQKQADSYFDQNGTLEGFAQKLPQLSDYAWLDDKTSKRKAEKTGGRGAGAAAAASAIQVRQAVQSLSKEDKQKVIRLRSLMKQKNLSKADIVKRAKEAGRPLPPNIVLLLGE